MCQTTDRQMTDRPRYGAWQEAIPPFCRSLVCLSFVTLVHPLDAIWQVQLWDPVTHCVRWVSLTTLGKGRFGGLDPQPKHAVASDLLKKDELWFTRWQHGSAVTLVSVIITDETPRNQSWLTRLWGRLVWLASGYQPTTFSYQKSLPRLPVPPLGQTIDRFLVSMQPLYGANSEQFKKLSTSAQVLSF